MFHAGAAGRMRRRRRRPAASAGYCVDMRWGDIKVRSSLEVTPMVGETQEAGWGSSQRADACCCHRGCEAAARLRFRCMFFSRCGIHLQGMCKMWHVVGFVWGEGVWSEMGRGCVE